MTHLLTICQVACSMGIMYNCGTNLIKNDLLLGDQICCESGKVETIRSIAFTLVIVVDYINDLLFSTSRSFMFSYVI